MAPCANLRFSEEKEAAMIRTAGELATALTAALVGDAGVQVSGIAGPEKARPTDVIYLDAPRFLDRVVASAAQCVLALPGVAIRTKTVLEVPDPKLSFAKAAVYLAPKATRFGEIHPTAIIAPTAQIGSDVIVGPYVVIEDEVEVGNASKIDAFCFLGRGAKVGADCRLHPRVTLYPEARLDDRVEVHSGAVIGSDGFGYVFGEGRWWKFPQVGDVEIADDVEIGANTTIDRGSLETTAVGAGTKMDNLVQIAHNVRVGENSVIASQVGISGSSTLGKRVMLGGQVGIADHCTLEDGAVVGAQSGVAPGKIVRRGQTVWGFPARPIEQAKKQFAWTARIPALAERVSKLEQHQTNDDTRD